MIVAAVKRWLPSLAWLGLIAILLLRGGFDAETLIVLGAIALVMAAASYVATRVARPWRGYFAVALGSIGVAALLFAAQGFTPIALLFWLVVTVLALVWAWYWERTEPLPDTRLT